MRDALVALVIMLPPSLVAAAALDAALSSVTAWEWAGVAILSIFAGFVALFQRIRSSQYALVRRAQNLPYRDADIINVSVWLYAATHMSGAILAGVLAFFLSVPVMPNGHTIAAAIAVAAYSGARFIERVAEQKNLTTTQAMPDQRS